MLVDLHQAAGGGIGGPHGEIFKMNGVDLLPIARKGHGEHPVVDRDPGKWGIGGRGERGRGERGDDGDENGPPHRPTLASPGASAESEVAVFELHTGGPGVRDAAQTCYL